MPSDDEILYTDGAHVTCTPFTVLVSFTSMPTPRPDEPEQRLHPHTVANLRMSPEHAKIFAIILRKRLRLFEAEQGAPIPIHPNLAHQLGVSPAEDW